MPRTKLPWAISPVLSVLACAAPGQQAKQDASTADALPTVVIVTTGGTIAEKTDPKTGAAVPAVKGADLVAAVPELSKVAKIEVVDFSNIDSSHMSPRIWSRLSEKVDGVLRRSDVTGVVVTHGTDTMAEGAYFLDLTLTSDKPVVFTGAMNDASSAHADGPGNMLNAVVQVCSDEARDWGVTVTLNRYINAARAVRKTQTTNVQTFESGERGYLGYVFDRRVIRFNDRPRRRRLPLPDELPKVVFISTYAGADGSLVRHAVDDGAKGIVVEGVGAGNVNAATADAIRYARSKDVVVAISSRVAHGAVEPVYGDEGGGASLQEAGCLLAGDLRGTKARLLLMLGIAKLGTDGDELRALFRP